MSETVIEAEGLRKEFRTRRGRHIVAVQDLDRRIQSLEQRGPSGGDSGALAPGQS